ncbi:hypothetical protein BD769DRAFT_1391687 [Suillus cothurnatus]|nr:hypothetical protein BD769DRAFT_1391687 [Suillus cothurnatus]
MLVMCLKRHLERGLESQVTGILMFSRRNADIPHAPVHEELEQETKYQPVNDGVIGPVPKGCNDSSMISRASSSEDSDADVLQFPVLPLTACALLNVLIIAIVCHYNAEVDGIYEGTLGVIVLCHQLVRPENTTKQVPWQVYVFKAMDAVKDIILDVTHVLQIRDPKGEPPQHCSRTIWSAVEHG